ncbi:unnamed protein product [Adineta ricciae]|uniref:Carbonic anhydrase n=1 Tax=Adineta ricciae TaxID=249248 RepID=A0A815VNB4_ADIRI|nr:unnamed protein product [Adineta ricciae]CAF1531121.1 unnamed protein product [Adineta ricciae]
MTTMFLDQSTDGDARKDAENTSETWSNLIENTDYGILRKTPNYDVKIQRQRTHARPLGEGRPVFIICCYDPRTDPAAELVLKHINYTGLFLQVRVAGGRAIDALRSLITAHYMFHLEVIAVVHHTFCGCTSFTLSTISEALAKEDNIHINEEILNSECIKALTIENLNKSVKDDMKLIRERVASPNAKILGFVFDIRTGELIPIE